MLRKIFSGIVSLFASSSYGKGKPVLIGSDSVDHYPDAPQAPTASTVLESATSPTVPPVSIRGSRASASAKWEESDNALRN